MIFELYYGLLKVFSIFNKNLSTAQEMDLQAQLKKTEEERDRLRNNILTLKAKIIDTASLINLFTESKGTENNNKTSNLTNILFFLNFFFFFSN